MEKKIVLAVTLVSFLLFCVLNLPDPVRIQGDGVFYYSWAHSALFDRDLDFRNQLEHFSSEDHYSRKFIAEGIRTPSGMTPNPYAFGSAILWSPFIALAQGATLFLNYLLGGKVFAPDGFSFWYVFLINLASWSFGTASFVLNWKTARLFFSEKVSLVVTLLVWLGTPWIYYQFFEPTMSHMASLVSVSVLLYLAARNRTERSVGSGSVLSSSFLAAAARWQNALICLAVGIFIWPRKNQSRIFSRANLLIGLSLLVAGIIQSFAWKEIYGSYWLIPQGKNFLFSQFHGLATLFSSDRGLFFWSPLTLVSFVGIRYWYQKDRTVLFGTMAAFWGQWLINSLLSDPGGGDAFGGRRFIETLPFLGLLLAGAMIDFGKKKMLIIGAILAGWNLLLLVGYHYDLLPRAGRLDLFRIIREIGEKYF